MKHQPKTIITSEAMLCSELFHKGRFRVPWHQRYYDWDREHVRALLNDILGAMEENRECYFLGAIMLVKVEEGFWEINDGQQRMITLSLICAVLCRHFAVRSPGSQHEGLALQLLFDLHRRGAWTLNNASDYTPRITPPQNDEMYFNQVISGNTIGTNGKFTAAWREVTSFFSGMSNVHCEQYLAFVLQKLEIACLWVPANIDSNAVFETLNFRGKKLGALDLIRNHLYSYFNSESESGRRRKIHAHLEDIRLAFPHAIKASEYMRCQMQCLYGFLRKDHFYRDARREILAQSDKSTSERQPQADYAFALVEKITSRKHLELFRTITSSSPNPDLIQAFTIDSRTTNSQRSLSAYLRELNGYKVTQPLLFALLAWYLRDSDPRKRKRVAKIVNRNLGRLTSFVLRTAFVAKKFEPTRFESAFANFAQLIMSAEDLPDKKFAQFLRDCDHAAYGVLDDSNFYSSLLTARMTGKRKIRLFLLGVNGDIQPDSQILNEQSCTIEHILPESSQHWDHWKEFAAADKGDWAHRIGNLTLMGPADNKPGPKFNGSFEKKVESYQNSALVITRKIAEFSDWSPDSIQRRQRAMAKIAVRVWKFA